MTPASAPQDPVTLADIAGADSGSVLLCPLEARSALSRELRAHIRADVYIERCEITDLSRWAAQLWDRAMLGRLVLRPVQLRALLRQVIETSGGLPDNLLQPGAVESEFLRAFDLVEQYRLDISQQGGIGATPEQQLFLRWHRELRRALQERNAMASSQLPAQLCAEIDQLQGMLPAQLILHPRLQPSRSELEFIEACAARGSRLRSLLQEDVPDTAYQVHCAADPLEEMETMAAWVAARFDAAAEKPIRVGLVLAPGDHRRGTLSRVLARYLHPDILAPGADGADELLEPWQFHNGGSLADFPVVRAALDLVALGSGAIELETLSRILRSPFICNAGEMAGQRAALDRKLREQLPPRLSLTLASRRVGKDLVAAWAPLAAIADVCQPLPRRQAASAWALVFNDILRAAGWPARDPGDGVVDQCRKSLAQTLDALRALDHCCATLSFSEALQWWRDIVNGKRFELRRGSEAPLQIVDFEQAGEERFDALWLLGLHDRALPQPLLWSPFLPRDTLLAAAVPRIEAADALAQDTARLQRVLNGATTAVVSFARLGDDESEQTACPLLAWQRPLSIDAVSPALQWSARLEWPASDEVEPVSAAERANLRGGSSLFANIARSPFIAFCRQRLNLEAFPITEEGLTAREQGDWIHLALARIWEVLGDSDALHAQSPVALGELIERAVDAALPDHLFREDWHGRILMATEAERIRRLLDRWLILEKQRELPFRVIAREQPLQSELHGIALALRIDRIDCIEGRHVLIDYKTGAVRANEVNASELLAPQLPIYALLAAPDILPTVNGIALAQVSERHGCAIYLRSDWQRELVPRPRSRQRVYTPEIWQSELSDWDRALAQMAQRFLSGDIRHAADCNASRFDYEADLAPLWSVLEYQR